MTTTDEGVTWVERMWVEVDAFFAAATAAEEAAAAAFAEMRRRQRAAEEAGIASLDPSWRPEAWAASDVAHAATRRWMDALRRLPPEAWPRPAHRISGSAARQR